MVWNIIKKQGLLFLRNPQELLLLLALPMILITILSTALGGLINGGSSPISINVAFIEHGDEQREVEKFLRDIEEQLPPQAVEEVRANIEQMLPITIIKESIFGNEEISEFIEVDYLNVSKREDVLNNDEYTTLIEVPENFTYDTLTNLVFDSGKVPSLILMQNEGQQVGTGVINNLLTQFQEQLTLGEFLGKNQIDMDNLQLTSDVKGEIVTINEQEPVSSKAYYTLGMVLMNVLFLAGAIGSYAFHEKQIHVFDRIMIANVSRWSYFIGVLLSGTIFAFIQCLIIFGFSRVVFGVTWPDLTAFFLITLAFSLSVGGIAVLLVAISYRINTETITNFFTSIIVTLFAVLGGSFAPIGDYSKVIQFLGNLTPNGASMTAYLTILRGEELLKIGNEILYLIGFAAAAVVIAVLCFPKRRLSQ
ncbi:ABC transporter permease [Ornithinibacillus californiensis]|uniref:ABC transporter permease n=1 Tax=Ornithinibacillus californiensis TaxID=161536 RepID=UPI00064DF176|nr:ABC transporter permease [Ornithinibacillus californiensis]